MDKVEVGACCGLLSVLLASLSCLLLLASCSLPRIIVLDDPLSPEEHLNLGVAYEKKAEYDPAIDEYIKASKQINLAYVYLGNVYFQKGDYEKAERSYKKAIDKDPSLADAYNNLAWLHYSKRKVCRRPNPLPQEPWNWTRRAKRIAIPWPGSEKLDSWLNKCRLRWVHSNEQTVLVATLKA